ncbi:MAG TPA: AAA family ATPase [Jatrophihabitantaceae bacterium]|nr:AAA family ATPase [Jatrophihabitantaceae bacterium]
MPSCVACGTENPPVARFCLSCGTALTEAARSVDERRIVTIIFVDLVGFTGRAERLDPEDVRALLAPYHQRVRREIESFGGTVEKFIGDAVMGVFGAPVAHGDDAERAVRAALAVRDIAGELADGDLQLRIAVNTGEAVVSLAARAALGEAMVAGDVVNTAARLQTAAPINGVIVGFETYLATRELIRYEATTPVVAKGKQLPVEAWVAVEALRRSGAEPIDTEGIVGRTHELAILEALWDRAVAARLPTLVSVIGPPGVGKSTVAAEFARIVTASGAQVVYGRSMPYRESGAYGALAGQLMRLADVFESDPPDVVADKLHSSAVEFLAGPEADPAAVADDLAALVGTSSGPAANDRKALFHSVRDFLEGAVRERPTVLVFEDIHWADPNMLDLVLALAALVRDVPLCMLTLARPELIDARADWGAGAPDFFGLTLGPLDEEQSRELVSRHIGDAAQAAAVLQTAEGNPLFIAQLAASVGELPAGKLPTNIREIVAARLDALPQTERTLLLDAAVIGRVFWIDALQALNASADGLPRLLDQLERRDLVRRDTGSIFEGKTQFTFTHALIREVAYEMLPRAERTRRHATVAEFFERTAGASSEALGALARHWLAAGENDRAVEHLVQAAEVAERGWAKDHAAYLYREALALIPADDTDRRRAVQRKLALASAASLHAPDVRRAGNPQA